MAIRVQDIRIIFSGVLIVSAYMLHKILGYASITIALMLMTTVVAGTPIFRKAFGALRYKIVGIDALVTIAVLGALFIGEYWEAAAVTFLFMLGDYLESKTIEKTRSSIKELLDLAPDLARVKRGGQEIEIAPEDVVPGDWVIIRPGEKISVDGSVLEGSAYINQSAITGEPIPVQKNPGDPVYSGTVIESGYLIVQANQVGDDTTFARILEMVEEAQDKKAQTQKFLEKFSRYYTPAIIFLAVVFYLLTRDLVLALTLLVIACPGALVISTPVSIVAGIGNGAKNGVLIKGGEIMEQLGTAKVIAFDKTGTLTIGQPQVTKIKAYDISKEELLKIAAIGEAYSEHPLAKAIIAKASEHWGQINEKPSATEIIIGQGLRFTYRGQDYLIGNRKLFLVNGLDIGQQEAYLEAQQSKGHTSVIIGDQHKVYGIISIADVVRVDTKNLVAQLHALGIKRTVMLTGDNSRAAQAISEQIGLDEYYGELLPGDKVRLLDQLQEKHGRTVMVGDGVNDAPALASADLGIAMGGIGTDVAMETADVILMSSELKKLAYAIGLSRATVRNMKQNIYFAIAVAAFLLIGVLLKTVHLSVGMLIHELSVLLVIINAVRLLGYGRKGETE